MKALLFRVFFLIVSGLLLMPGPAMAQAEQETAGNPPLEQPLVREGDLAVKLVEALRLGTAGSETEAESILASLDITPRNGWIADYPVTPDIVDELEAAVGQAAESGKITVGKEAALKIVQDVINEYDLSVMADSSGKGAGEIPNYPDSEAENNYYYDEGPPVVTYYAPPPDYAYLYTWVPYSFWWSDFWFPGFFILADFDVPADRHRHRHRRGHDRDHGKFISNHFSDPKTGGTFRVNPATRSRGGIFPAGAGWSRPSSGSGARSILNTSRGRAATGPYREYRGYGVSGPPTGTRSSAFDRSPNSQFERNASDRGFQSRSSAGRVSGGSPSGGGNIRGGGAAGGFHGGGGVRR